MGGALVKSERGVDECVKVGRHGTQLTRKSCVGVMVISQLCLPPLKLAIIPRLLLLDAESERRREGKRRVEETSLANCYATAILKSGEEEERRNHILAQLAAISEPCVCLDIDYGHVVTHEAMSGYYCALSALIWIARCDALRVMYHLSNE